MSNENGNDESLPHVSVDQLNTMQNNVFQLVKNFSNNNKQLLAIVNGTAGTGKTFTICAITQIIQNTHARCAPTAKAAFLIKGETLHSTFYIPCSKKHSDEFPDLNGENLKKLQNKFLNKTHIIIDEYSMVSQVMLAQIDKRLRQATGKKTLFFGGLSVILIGDPGQLPPVSGHSLYHFPTTTTLA